MTGWYWKVFVSANDRRQAGFRRAEIRDSLRGGLGIHVVVANRRTQFIKDARTSPDRLRHEYERVRPHGGDIFIQPTLDEVDAR